MKYCSELSRVLLGDKTYRRHLQVGEWWSGKGAASLPRATSLAKFSETISGCAEAVGKFFENLAVREPV